MTGMYECDVEGCDWENPDWRYGFADAGATWAYHMSDHQARREDYCAHGMHRNAFHCYSCADEYMASLEDDRPTDDVVPSPGERSQP